jgi:EAL domain-containing protein (putative c-di-GMP-specific phosphodiesterase class I)
VIEQATAGAWVQGLLGAMPEAVALVDAALVVTVANGPFQRLVGADPVGRPLTALLAPEHSDVLRRALQRSRGTTTWVAASAVLTPDGTWLPVQVHIGGVEAVGVRAELVTLVPGAAGVAAPGTADLAAELADGLRGDQVVLHYQPVVRLTDRRPVLAEALARWEHPSRGLLWPADFLAAADTAELAGQLGQRVLREACHAAAAWARNHSGGDVLQVAVNLSERQLLQPGTVALVRDALVVADCAPAQLLLEVSESALQHDPDAAGRALRAMKDLGVDIAIDDLGTGSSALSYLKRFPVDLVKIDRSLVAGVGSDADQSAVVASLVSLSRALGVRCVAEGIETADQLAVLRRLGCDLGQGYMFTRPMARHAIEAWLIRARPVPARRAPAPAPAVPTVAAVRALELQEQGASLHTIAARLNAEGHRNAGGRRWHHTAVAQLITAQRFPTFEL